VRRIRKEEYPLGGRPPTDEVLIFKMSLLQDWSATGDDNTEYLVNCRLDWQRFLGMELGEKAPDAKTLWLFKEKMGEEGMRELFDLFNEKLVDMGIVKREGSLVDATFVEVPRQRNSREDNKTIKEGNVPEEWQKPENAAKLAQKDTDARWTKKAMSFVNRARLSTMVSKIPSIDKSGFICLRICAILFNNNSKPLASKNFGATGTITLLAAARAFTVSRSSVGAVSISIY
jgi:hypothetical protein